MILNLRNDEMFAMLRQAITGRKAGTATIEADWENLTFACDVVEEAVKIAKEAKLKAIQEERTSKARVDHANAEIGKHK